MKALVLQASVGVAVTSAVLALSGVHSQGPSEGRGRILMWKSTSETVGDHNYAGSDEGRAEQVFPFLLPFPAEVTHDVYVGIRGGEPRSPSHG
jgi:hypothetical protein